MWISDFTWNQLLRFDTFRCSEYWIWWIFAFADQDQNIRAFQSAKIAVLETLKWAKSISRKIWVAEKSWNFRTLISRKIFFYRFARISPTLWCVLDKWLPDKYKRRLNIPLVRNVLADIRTTSYAWNKKPMKKKWKYKLWTWTI